MAKSFWMVIKSPANFQIGRERNFDTVGLVAQHRRKVQRMTPGDRVLLYISQERCFGATATVTTPMVEDHAPIWKAEGGSDFPYRVGIKTEIVLNRSQYIDAYQIASRMDFTRRWIPELWYLAFQGSLHLISKYDFSMVEQEMRKQKHGTRSHSKPALPRLRSHCKLDQMLEESQGQLVHHE